MRLVLTILSLVMCCAAEAQYKGPKFPIKDKWFWTYGAKGLQMGDKMPDIALGSTINNKTGKTRLSQFRGKLVILDFWSTGCSNCIAGFSKMEKLQKEFGDQIQIILVNPWETGEQIKEGMEQKHLRQYKLPDLPCIVANRPYANTLEFEKYAPAITRYFPMQGVPHHVWIDGDGIIQLRGGAENTYATKIKELLSGKPIQVLQNSTTLPDLSNDPAAAYYQQLGFMRQTPLSFGSFITPYTSEVSGAYATIKESRDTSKDVRITSYINQRLLDLYFKCYSSNKDIEKAYTKFLFSPSNTLIDFIQFPIGIDTLIYTSDTSIIQRQLTTEEIIRSKYCYEQVVPLVLSEDERMQMMLEDLNRYFRLHYGIVGSMENRKVPFYELIRISDQDKVSVNSSGSVFQSKVSERDSRQVLDYKGPLYNLFAVWLRHRQLKTSQGLLYDSVGNSLRIFNGTGWDRKQLVSMQIPLTDLETVADLRRLLQPYGLDIAEKYGDLPFLVFTRMAQQPINHKQ